MNPLTVENSLFLCRQCHARPVERRGASCLHCIKMIAQNELDSEARAKAVFFWKAFAVAIVIGIFVAMAASFGGK